MASLAHSRLGGSEVERRGAGGASPSEGVCVECVLCGSGRSHTVCTATEMAAQRQYIAEFFRRRWRTQTAATAADRVAFTQDYTTDIVRCLGCGLLYRNPRPREEDITRAYRKDHYDQRYLETEFANQRRWAKRKAPELSRQLRAGKGRRPQVLEVGSFVGGLLAEGMARGWDMFGVDPGDEVTDFCRTKALPVFHGTLEQARLQAEHFDAVVIWNTFDQLPDPHPTLAMATRLLRSGGVLSIRVPNGACFAWAMERSPGLPEPWRRALYAALAWNNLLTFPYVYGYTADTLIALTGAYGFRPIGCLPDTVMPAPPGQTTWWAGMEAALYQGLWRAGWYTTSEERCVRAPWLDLYFERAVNEEPAAAQDSGLGLIPVYAPLALRQTDSLMG
jgi:SAM-dependent methyltransferase